MSAATETARPETAPPPTRVFDGHNDFLLRLWSHRDTRRAVWLERGEAGHLDLPRMRAGGFAGGLFAIFVPPAMRPDPAALATAMEETPYDLPQPPDCATEAAQATALAQASLFHWMERAAPDDFAVCRTAGQARAAMAAGRVAGVLHMEGAEAIDADLDALYAFHQMGLRSLGPVWSRPTLFGHGVPFRFPGDPDTGPGLTEAGERLVRACNELGVLIDLSHLNEKGVDDVARLSSAPLVATHSNAHAVTPSPRNLTDRQLAQIAETGGLVGLNFATFFLRPDGKARRDTPLEDALRHLDHLLSHLGEEGVAFGSDFDGCLLPQAIGDTAGLPALIGAMRAHGYGERLVAKIARENWLRLLDRVIG